MQEFLYHIIDPTTGLYYYYDSATKQVLTTIDPVFLKYTPDGWQKKAIGFVRSPENYGVIKSFTIPLQFVGDGARILRHLLYTKVGMETLADLSIKKLNPSTGQYLRYYRGEINFLEFEDELDSVSVNVIEGRIAKLLKANKSTKYEFDLDTIPETRQVYMDGVELDNIYHYAIPGVNFLDDRIIYAGFDVPVAFINKEGDSKGISAINTDLQGDLIVTTSNPFFKNLNKTGSITARIKGILQLAPSERGNVQVHIFCQDSATGNILNPGGIYTIMNQYCLANANVATAFDFPAVVIPAGYELKMWCTTVPLYNGIVNYPGYLDASKGYWNAATNTPALVNGTGNTGDTYMVQVGGTHDFGAGNITFAAKDYVIYSAGQWQKHTRLASTRVWFADTTMDMSFAYRFDPTWVKTLPVYALGKLLINKSCGIGYDLVSTLLNNRPDIAIASGDSIRGIQGGKIKTSWDDFFSSMDSLLMIGMSYDGDKVILEKRNYFYDNTTEIFDVGEVQSCVLSQAKDLVFNTIKIGYPNQQTKFDDINGRYEFNTTHQYTTPVTRIAKPYEQVSPYRADMYGIEIIRINLDEKKTTANDSDNDVFMLNVEDYVLPLTISFLNGNTFLVADGTPIKATDVITIGGTTLNNGVKNVIGVSTFIGTSGTVSLLVTVAEATFNEFAVGAILANNYKRLYRKVYDNYSPTNTSGLPYPLSAFNIEFSPKRMLLNHGSWISSIMYMLESKEVVFQTTDRNSELLTVSGTNVIKEKGNVKIGNLAPRFFKPYIFKIETSTPVNLAELAGSNSRGYVSFHWNGIKYRGFIINIEIQPATLEQKEFELLCCPDVDLTTYNNFS